MSRISEDASELGILPADSDGRTLELASGGRETSSPGGVAACVEPPDPGPDPNVPDMPIWPHAARTCGTRESVASVSASKAGVAASATG